MDGRGAEGTLSVGRMSVDLGEDRSVGCWFFRMLPTAVSTAGLQGLGCGHGGKGNPGAPSHRPLPTPLHS